MSKEAIAYILAEFPSQTETFILREALYINETIPLYIIVLKKGKILPDNPMLTAFGDRIVYVPSRWSPTFLLHGIRNIKTLCRRFSFTGLRNNLRRIKILLTASFISETIENLPIRHIHAHFANYPADVALMLSHLSGIPFSFTAHAHDIYVDLLQFPEKLRKATFVATCTEYNKKWLDAIAPQAERKKIHRIYHGVDVNYWKFRRPHPVGEPARILTIGRLVEKKGMIYLLKAVSRLSESGIPIQLYIVGKGVEENRLRDFCRQSCPERSVTFMGWQTPDQIRDLYARSDIFVLPSVITSDGDRDGIPNVILEAMASGLPVITTPISGITEVIRHGYNGWLVPERNATQLADSILTLINDEALRNSLCNHALQTISEKFDSQNCNLSLKNLFDGKS